jgi:DNA polymerase V
MFALIDCNSFFCSVEKVFHPGLKNKPVVVLSSNDGCIVALTSEAKAVGLHRGDPIFKVKDIVTHNNVHVFSTNMMLYAAMSKRIVSIMRESVCHVEQYSIDESFCDLHGYEKYFDLVEMMRELKDKILLYTDIPVSVGIAPTKTLAKMGSKFAKQYKGYRGVCMIDTDEKRRKALSLFPLDDVWGIGRQTLAKLKYHGIRTPLDFAGRNESWVRSHFTKPGIQTWLELNGHPCIDTAEIHQKKTICTSRSFGEMVSDFDSLKASIATFASSCANKLRGQASGAKSVTVFIASNRFREDLPQYGNSATVPLLVPTSDTLEITSAAIRALQSIWREGIQYKRSGVIVSDIHPNEHIEGNLFDPIKNRPERARLMQTIDNINHLYGLKTIQMAVEGDTSQPVIC